MGKPTVTISLETLETIYDIYVESDDLVGAAASTIEAVQEVEELHELALEVGGFCESGFLGVEAHDGDRLVVVELEDGIFGVCGLAVFGLDIV